MLYVFSFYFSILLTSKLDFYLLRQDDFWHALSDTIGVLVNNSLYK